MDLKEFSLFNSGNRNNTFDADFLVSKRVKHVVMDFRAVNERICSLRLRGRFINIRFTNCHAPTEEKEARVTGNFYRNLERIYETACTHDIKVILGDFNAKIGKEIGYRAKVAILSMK